MEQFSRWLRGRELPSSTETDLVDFLADVGRRRDLQEWQLKQIVDALEILLVDVLALYWATTFDWDFWRSAARNLELGHPTIAREPVSHATEPTQPLPEEGLREL